MIVAVISMLMMQVIIDQIVHMVSVRYGFMTAIWPMNMFLLVRPAIMAGCAIGRISGAHLDRVLVHLIASNMMQMAIVEVVRVTVVLYTGVATVLIMSVVMTFVRCVSIIHGCRPLISNCEHLSVASEGIKKMSDDFRSADEPMIQPTTQLPC
jgi:hypothetical protein